MDEGDLIRFCDDHDVREHYSTLLYESSVQNLAQRGHYKSASEIIRKLPSYQKEILLNRIREVIENHGRNSELIQRVTKEYLGSIGYGF